MVRARRGSGHPAGNRVCRGRGGHRGHHGAGRCRGCGRGVQLRTGLRHLPLDHARGVPAGDRRNRGRLPGGAATGATGERRRASAGRGAAAAGTAGAGARDRHLRRHPAPGRRSLRRVPVRGHAVQQLRRRAGRTHLDLRHLPEPGEGLGGARRRPRLHAPSPGRPALLGRRAVHRRRHPVLVEPRRTDRPHLSRPVHPHHHFHRLVRERREDRRLHRARRIQQAVRQPVLGALRQGGPRPPEAVLQPVPPRFPGPGQAGRDGEGGRVQQLDRALRAQAGHPRHRQHRTPDSAGLGLEAGPARRLHPGAQPLFLGG